jgi:hypothetical protein
MPHIYGQILNAQLENSSGDPSTAASIGRVYIDVTSAANAVPKFNNGTSYVPFGSAVMTANLTGTATFNSYGNSETIYNLGGGTLSTLALTLPTTTSIGQICRYMTKPAVTTITLTGTVVAGAALTSMTANTIASYQAINTTGSFIRIQ